MEPARRERAVAVRGKASGDGFDSEEDGNGGGSKEWEAGLERRVKEIEEMKELGKKAEELQSRAEEEKDGGSGATEGRSGRVFGRSLRRLLKSRGSAELLLTIGFLEAALAIIPRPTLFGGRDSIWLAMMYKANSCRADYITLYLQLEKTSTSKLKSFIVFCKHLS
ncbi:hypothetical protein MLD38_009407 [Melastoma candidum]|uniref:Uncharacterized protein n=1 Tax=Melastoma candidum TaxID=119954 RepID=A0ACB9RZD4_9MYRT|nr:hypothetical protein MLD38_009407 [Melastoma candidum]